MKALAVVAFSAALAYAVHRFSDSKGYVNLGGGFQFSTGPHCHGDDEDDEMDDTAPGTSPLPSWLIDGES